MTIQQKNIPLVDLGAQYRSIKTEVDTVIANVLEHSAFIGGTFVQQFEEEFAKAQDVKYCVGVGNGTDAIIIVLKALGIGVGDEVIIPANSFIATSEAVTACGASVVFADCGSADYCISPESIAAKITIRTKAVVAVHLYGQPAQMDEIIALTKKHNLFLIEDSAQAHLAEYKGKKVGNFGIAATFSFYPGKNLGSYGDAGAIVTNDEALAVRCRMLANHGRAKGEKYDHNIEGYNSRLDGLQAAILSVKLKHLSEWTKKRRAVAQRYDEEFRGMKDLGIFPRVAERESVYHLYVVRTKKRDALREYLKAQGIEAGIHYPIGLPFLEAYKRLGHTPADFPHTAQFQNEILSLPIYPELTTEDQSRIINACAEFCENKTV